MVSAKKKKSSDHQNWEVIYDALKQMLRQQSSQLEALLEENARLQERALLKYHRWNSDVRLLKDVISQLQRQLSLSEMEKMVEIAKAGMLVGSKQRKALLNKLKLERTQSELDDFKAWFDILSHRCPGKEDCSPDKIYESLKAKGGSHSNSKEACTHHSKLENEVAMLKREYEKLSLKHKSDMSALQDENTFVWNQYKEMEGIYNGQLQAKNDEINKANKKITNLLTTMEQLQSASIERDDTVANLRTNISNLEAEANDKDGEISRLSKELEFVKSKITGGSSEPSSSSLKGKRNRGKRKSAALEEEQTSAQLQVVIYALRAKVSELEAAANKKTESNSSADTVVLKRCTRSGRAAAVEEEKSLFKQLEATMASLRVKISDLEAEARQKNGEISTLSKELELLRSKSTADTPALKRCKSIPSSSRLQGRENGRDQGGAGSKEETSSTGLVSEQGVRRSQSKQGGTISMEDTPRLFNSQFKIPKLRSQSPLNNR